ncbi:MAG: WecB/TagA/CpsF family glycosyltransferase [Phycisphaeraceae bacterium]
MRLVSARSAEVDAWLADEASAALPRVTLGDVALHAVSESRCIRHVLGALSAGRGGWVITPNLDHLRRARHDTAYRGMLGEADLVVADGMPLVWASRLQGTPLPERVPGSSLTCTLSEAAALRGHSLFLIGGAPGTADAAAETLRLRFPGLTIAGTHAAPYGFQEQPEALASLRERLHLAGPDIVFVALGSPKQERLIREMRSVLPRAWWLGVGISFSFVCGDVRRAPQWMQAAGLEWAHRLAHEPGRLARRYLVDGPPFAVSMLCRAGLRRVGVGD